MTRQVVDHIFPNRGSAQHRHTLGKAQRVANQAAIHVARGQVGAFNVGGMQLQGSIDLSRLTTDHPRFGSDHPSLLALLDHLHILPLFAGLLERWRASTSAVVRYFTIDFHQGFPVTAPAIRDQRRRGIGMAPALELLEECDRCIRFPFADPTSHTPPSVNLNQGAAPEFALFVACDAPPLCPLCPT